MTVLEKELLEKLSLGVDEDLNGSRDIEMG